MNSHSLPERDDRQPMSDTGKVLFAAFSQVAKDEQSEIALQCKRSLTANAIAELLAGLAQAEVGVPVEKRLTFLEIQRDVRERIRAISQRAVKHLDLDFRVRVANTAVGDLIWELNGPGNMKEDAPTTEEIARKAIGYFLQNEDLL